MGISIVIPLYNKEKHIANTLERVFQQSYSDFEVVIVNDGSTDNSVSIVESFSDSRIKLISQKNQGAASARNKGVSLAKHNHVAFLDADDEWGKDYLFRMNQLIERYPEAVLYGTNYYIIENGQRSILTYPGVKQSEGIIDNYFLSKEYTPLWTSAVVVKKAIFNQLGGFPTKCKVCEDIDLWCRFALNGDIAYINEPLANYRRDSTNMLSKSTDTTYYFPFLDEYKKCISNDDERYSSVQDYVCYKQLFSVSFCLRNRNKKEAKQILKRMTNPGIFKTRKMAYALLALMPQRMIDFVFAVSKEIRGKK